jgi:hypothetical protein
MDMFDRNEKIYELRKRGITYTEISGAFPVCYHKNRLMFKKSWTFHLRSSRVA